MLENSQRIAEESADGRFPILGWLEIHSLGVNTFNRLIVTAKVTNKTPEALQWPSGESNRNLCGFRGILAGWHSSSPATLITQQQLRPSRSGVDCERTRKVLIAEPLSCRYGNHTHLFRTILYKADTHPRKKETPLPVPGVGAVRRAEFLVAEQQFRRFWSRFGILPRQIRWKFPERGPIPGGTYFFDSAIQYTVLPERIKISPSLIAGVALKSVLSEANLFRPTCFISSPSSITNTSPLREL